MSWDAGAITGTLGLNVSEYAHGMLEAEGLAHAFPPIVVEFLENPLIGLMEVAKEAGEAIADMVGEVLNSAYSTELAAQKAGLSIEAFSKLSFAAKEVNLSTEQLSVGLRMLQRNAADVLSGDAGKQAQESFQKLGISMQFLKSHLDDTQGLFTKIQQGIDRLHSPAEKTAAAMHILGRSGADLVPLLAMGSDAIEQIGQRAAQFGALEMEESARTGKAWKELTVELEMAWEGIKKTFAEELAPTLMNYIRELLAYIQQHMPEIRQEVKSIAQSVASAVQTIGPLILWTMEHIEGLAELLGAAGLVAIVGGSIAALGRLGATFQALSAQIMTAAAAQQAFNAASTMRNAGVGGGIGAGVGLLSTGDTGGVIGGGLGGILGAILGSFFGPIGTYLGSALGGYVGGQVGHTIENHYHQENQVRVDFDPREAASQLAESIGPQLKSRWEQVDSAMQSAGSSSRVRSSLGGRRPHYYSGL